MSGRISNSLGSVATVGSVLLSGILVGPRADTAHADTCLAAPNSPAPVGSHWYYRSDRANARKCWYVRVIGEPAQQPPAAAMAETETTSPAATSDNRATAAPASIELKENASSSPHSQTCSPADHCLVTIVAANKFQPLLTADNAHASERRALTIENRNSNGDSCWVYVGNNPASKQESEELTAGKSFVRYWPFVPSGGVQATCASNSDTLHVQISRVAAARPTLGVVPPSPNPQGPAPPAANGAVDTGASSAASGPTDTAAPSVADRAADTGALSAANGSAAMPAAANGPADTAAPSAASGPAATPAAASGAAATVAPAANGPAATPEAANGAADKLAPPAATAPAAAKKPPARGALDFPL